MKASAPSDTFWKTWRDDWSNKLRFRGRQQHALCSTCVSHKLLIKQLSNDLLKRNRQVQLYEEHKNAQYRDRRVYWSVRAEAMLVPLTVCIILDGMDQGRFCCPRSEIMKSKSLEPLQRPRLHVNAAICHGRTLLVSVSPADFPKNTDVTIELVAACLTMLAHEGLVLARAHLHLQLDNTSSSNKNNHMFPNSARVGVCTPENDACLYCGWLSASLSVNIPPRCRLSNLSCSHVFISSRLCFHICFHLPARTLTSSLVA